mgnify:FL=1
MNKKKPLFLNSLYMDFLTENELDLFLKSLDQIWTAELYANLKQNGLIRHVISKVWNKGQHRITQVFEYENQDSFKKCESILNDAFTPENCPVLAKFVFKIFNNRGIVVSEFKND